MKLTLLSLTFFSFSLYADVNMIKKGLEAVSTPAKLGIVDCNDPNAPAWCRDLYKSVCEIKKTTNKHEKLNDSIYKNTYGKLPPNPVKKTLYDAGEAAIKLADEVVYKQGKVVRKDVIDTFLDTKSIMYRMITSNNHISQTRKREMVKKIERINLKSGFEYVEELVNWAQKQEPGNSRENHRYRALEFYASACGPTGMEVNAFFEEGNLVLCPGLVSSLDDYKTKNKQEVLNALAFTIGHEIGHSIDYSSMPDVYSKFKSCYEETMEDKSIFSIEMGNEIIGDYWGALVLGQILKNQNIKGQDAVRAVTYAVDGFCEQPAQTAKEPIAHPEGQFRVNVNIAKAPLMREALGCDAPSKENPTCWLDGVLNKNVR